MYCSSHICCLYRDARWRAFSYQRDGHPHVTSTVALSIYLSSYHMLLWCFLLQSLLFFLNLNFTIYKSKIPLLYSVHISAACWLLSRERYAKEPNRKPVFLFLSDDETWTRKINKILSVNVLHADQKNIEMSSAENWFWRESDTGGDICRPVWVLILRYE
jgi:hypothetical protein